MPLLPLWAVRPVQSLSACTGCTLPYLYLFPCYDAGSEFSLVCELKTRGVRTERCNSSSRYASCCSLLNNFCLFFFTLPYIQYSRLFPPCNCAIAFYAKEPWVWTLHNAFTLPTSVVKIPQVYMQHLTSYLLGAGSDTVINCTVSKYVLIAVYLCFARLNLLEIRTSLCGN